MWLNENVDGAEDSRSRPSTNYHTETREMSQYVAPRCSAESR